MANVVPGILTMGLGGNQNAMIIGFPFSLGFVEVIIPPIPTRPPGGSGGAMPAFPDRTERWDEDAPRTIIIRIKYNNKRKEKIYLVSSKRADFIIQVMNIINVTRERIKITVANLKKKTFNVFARIKNAMHKNNGE